MDEFKILTILQEFRKLRDEVDEMERINNRREFTAEKKSKADFYNWRRQGLEVIIEALEYAAGLNTNLEGILESYKAGIADDIEELKGALKSEGREYER